MVVTVQLHSRAHEVVPKRAAMCGHAIDWFLQCQQDNQYFNYFSPSLGADLPCSELLCSTLVRCIYPVPALRIVEVIVKTRI